MDKKKIIEKLLMAAGFIIGGIGMASTFGDIPDNIKSIKEHLTDEEAPDKDKDE